MKKLIVITVVVAITLAAASVDAKRRRNVASMKYAPISEFVNIESTLGQWYKQYMDTTSGTPRFKDFLKRLSKSDILYQRGKYAGLSHNQLYSPMVTLMDSNLKEPRGLSEEDRLKANIAMTQMDIALAAVESTLPANALEEFRREVIRGAKPLPVLAEAPTTAVEVMTFTMMDHKISDRLNKMPPSKIKPKEIMVNPGNDYQSGFRMW